MDWTACPITKMEKFVVATDGSEFSESAVREAINLAKICSSKLIALSIVTATPVYDDFVPQVAEKMEKDARVYLEAAKARASLQGVDCEIVLRRGDEPYEDIIDIASSSGADMIIMGTHGRTGIDRLMMGSVTARVIGHSRCDVLVVPGTARVECKKILAATDGSRYGNAAVSEAIGISKRCGSSLIISSVAFIDEEIESLDEAAEIAAAEERVKKAVAFAEKEGIKAEGMTLKGKPYRAITDACAEKHADLVVVGSHGRSGLDRLLMGSVTERVIGHSKSAVLVVKI